MLSPTGQSLVKLGRHLDAPLSTRFRFRPSSSFRAGDSVLGRGCRRLFSGYLLGWKSAAAPHSVMESSVGGLRAALFLAQGRRMSRSSSQVCRDGMFSSREVIAWVTRACLGGFYNSTCSNKDEGD